MDIHQDLESIKMMAIHFSKLYSCNYNIILMNPDQDGNFSVEQGSTYEYVKDSYFTKPRPNVIILNKTKDL